MLGHMLRNLMFFSCFFPVFFCSSRVASLDGKRSYPTPAGLWLPFSWLLLPLRVQSWKTQIAWGFKNSYFLAHTPGYRGVDLEFFRYFFRCQIHIHDIFYWSGIVSIMMYFVFLLWLSVCNASLCANDLRIPLIVSDLLQFLASSLRCVSFSDWIFGSIARDPAFLQTFPGILGI